MTCKSLIMLFLLGGCLSAPIDDPIRIDLPVYDQPQSNSDTSKSSNDGQTQVSVDQPQVSSNVQVSQGILPENYPGGEPDPAGGNFITQKLQVANTFLGNTLDAKPKPIVDTISESDKYGNTGDKFYAAGQALVKGASGVSNIVNSILEIPGTLFKTVARSATEKLNNFGGKLIGL